MRNIPSRFLRALAAVAVAVTVSGCTPQAMIAVAFDQHGPAVVDEAIEVADCETGGQFNADAVSPSGGHFGVFQLSRRYHEARANRLGWSWDQVQTDTMVNALVAADLYREQGWRPWSCAP